MALSNYVYQNNGTKYAPEADSNKTGAFPLLGNVDNAATSGAFPFIQATNVFENILICAKTWGSATVSIEVSYDGVNCWTPLNYGGALTPLTNINTNIYVPIVARDVYMRAVMTGSGTGISVFLC